MRYRDVIRGSLIFWIVIPVSIAVVLGNYHAGAGWMLSKPLSILYWIGFLFFSWAAFEIGTYAVRRVTDPLGLSPTISLALGPILALIFAKPIARLYYEQWIPLFPPGTTWMPRAISENWFENFILQIGNSLALIVMWFLVNLCFDYFSIPRFQMRRTSSRGTKGQAVEPMPQSATDPIAKAADKPNFIRHLPSLELSDILVLEAEDHYTRVHTARGSVLLPGRFRDAVAQCAGRDGLRVHRSFWVARDAIRECKMHNGGIQLYTHNGMEIPVSRSHYALVKSLLDVQL